MQVFLMLLTYKSFTPYHWLRPMSDAIPGTHCVIDVGVLPKRRCYEIKRPGKLPLGVIENYGDDDPYANYWTVFAIEDDEWRRVGIPHSGHKRTMGLGKIKAEMKKLGFL